MKKKAIREQRLEEFFKNNPQPKCANPNCSNLCYFRPKYWKWSVCCSNSCVSQYTQFIAKQDVDSYKLKQQKSKQTKQKNLEVKTEEEIQSIKQKATEKRKQTLLEKYGTDNIQEVDGVLEKRKKTCMEKYGTDNPFTSDAVKEKIKATMIERYGVERPLQNTDINNKRRQTNVERYGQEEVGDVFFDKARATTLERYGVEYYVQTEEYQRRRRETMMELYGGGSKFYQYYTIIGKEIMEAEDVELLVEMNQHMSLTEISVLHGMSLGALVQRLSKHGIKSKVHYTSLFHREVVDFLRDECGVENIKENVRNVIAPHEIDILINDHLGIECNGLFWHSQNSLEGRIKNFSRYHQQKTLKMQELGNDLLHLFQSDWNNKREICKSIIKARLNLFDKVVYARKATIAQIDASQERKFIDSNHIQGYVPSSYCVGLFYDNELISIMSFKRTRFSKKAEWELLRFCNILNTTVMGGAERLFSHFIKQNNPKSVLSYCHLHLFTGKIYYKMGFKPHHTTEPGYWYTRDYKTLHNRIQFQKHKLKNILLEFDETASEWENMKNNGWDRIWDCGNVVFIYENKGRQ